MDIKDIGGEFALINRLTQGAVSDKNVVKGIGDDAAVLEWKDDKYLLITTDMLVENDHFNLQWSTPQQIGTKLMEVNVSDIVAMGGTPTFAVVSAVLKKDTSVEFMDEFYQGLQESAKKHGVQIIGGDITHGTELVFNVTLLGEVKKDQVCLRSGAKVSDLICVTGQVGGSTAGLRLKLKNKEGYLKDHLEPKSRTAEEGMKIAKFAHAMIDVSDGVGSEVKHLCEESKVGARIDIAKIPLSHYTRASAKTVDEDPLDFALYGGEDFELVFTITEENVEKLKKEFTDFTIIGEILNQKEGIHSFENGKKKPLAEGYNHFS